SKSTGGSAGGWESAPRLGTICRIEYPAITGASEDGVPGQLRPLLFNEEGRLRAGYRVAIFFVLWGYGPAVAHWVLEATLLRSVRGEWLWAESILLNVLRLVVILLAGWWVARVVDRRPFADYGFHLSRRWWVDFGFGLLLGAMLMALIFVIELG